MNHFVVQWKLTSVHFSSVTQSCPTLWSHGLQYARPPCPSPAPGVYSNLCPLNQWCHPMISSSAVPFSCCLQSFLKSGSFQMSQLFPSGSQSIGVSASTSVLPMNTQGWSPLGWAGWISLWPKELSRVFSNTTVQKLQLFGTQLSLWPNSHIHTWLLINLIRWTFVGMCLLFNMEVNIQYCKSNILQQGHIYMLPIHVDVRQNHHSVVK